MVRTELPLRYGYSITCTRFTIDYTDLNALSASVGPQSITLRDAGANAFQVAQGGIVLGIRIKHDVQFAAPALAALTMTIGKGTANATTGAIVAGGVASFFVPVPFDLMAAVADGTVSETMDFLAGQDTAFSLFATFTGDAAANIKTVTAGQVHIDVFLLQIGPVNTQAYPPSVTP